jgi:hypothetical protein
LLDFWESGDRDGERAPPGYIRVRALLSEAFL